MMFRNIKGIHIDGRKHMSVDNEVMSFLNPKFIINRIKFTKNPNIGVNVLLFKFNKNNVIPIWTIPNIKIYKYTSNWFSSILKYGNNTNAGMINTLNSTKTINNSKNINANNLL